MKSLNKIVTLISSMTYCYENKTNQNACGKCLTKLNVAISYFIENDLSIQIVLPAFPAKSANRNKTISALPDLGEALALKKLDLLINSISKIYDKGADFIICSDGHVFNDLVGVNDSDVDSYQTALIKQAKHLGFNKFNFFDLSNIYSNLELSKMRTTLIKEYGQDIEEIKSNIKNIKDEMLTFNGLHRFLHDDLNYLLSNTSKNKVKKIAKEKAYQTIQRSHAWSKLVSKQFPRALRLSIHPHKCESTKIPIKLVDSSDHWATPWHNVVVKTKLGFKLMKRQLAIKSGAILKNKNEWNAHYVLPENSYVI